MPRSHFRRQLFCGLTFIILSTTSSITCASLPETEQAVKVLSFVPIHVGEMAVKTMTIEKAGFGTAITTGDFTSTNDCSSSTSGTCNISVTFSPLAVGVRGGALIIESRDMMPLQIIGLTGIAIGPAHLVVSSTVLSFDSQDVMTTSVKRDVVLGNDGGTTLHLGNIFTTAEFTHSTDCTEALEPGASCKVSLAFSPIGPGPRGGVLVIDDASGSLIQIVALGGTGTGTPQVTVSAAALQFKPQKLSSISETQEITLKNIGSVPIQSLSVEIDGNFEQTSSCAHLLPANGSCTVIVSFMPNRLGEQSGHIQISADLMTKTVVNLTGTGIPAGNITAVWANEGGDKVTRDELRASHHTENLTGTVMNRAWNGNSILLSGARNEVVSFNVILEAANGSANNVTVKFDTMTGPNGAIISSTPTSGDGVFNWVGRNIELFYVRYLQIRGLSYFGYYKGDERQFPVRFQTPWRGNGIGTGLWTDRPDHDKFYPDIMVPIELVPTFSIAQGQNQSIWTDIYIPKNVPAGIYCGTVSILEDSIVTHEVPVSLNVQSFSLPDSPTTKTMVNLDTTDIMWRYVTGTGGYVNWNSQNGHKIANITDKYFELFHRHKISLLGENECPVADHPCDTALPRLYGNLFTAEHGYDGPGTNVSEGIYSIGTYGTWGAATYGVPDWKYDKALFQNHIDNYARWFSRNLPTTDYFIYLEDEPPASHFGQVETWAQWIAQDPGPGKNMLSLATVNAVAARAFLPTVSIPVTAAGIGACPTSSPCDPAAAMENAANFYKNTPGRKFWAYNDGRPGTGTALTEDDGVSMRTIPWTQYKMGIDRWFYWYANVNTPLNWFQTATTWGSVSYFDRSMGQYGWDGTSNGNGLLVYPGTDVNYPADSYGVNGPLASLRLKEWRRGVQDTDYLAIANQIDPIATQAIVNQAMPKALWENKAPGGDSSYFIGPISWSSNPDDWEARRERLSQLINGYCTGNPSSGICAGN